MTAGVALLIVVTTASSAKALRPSAEETKVYRAVVEHFAKELPANSRVVCVAVGAADATPELLRALALKRGSVEPASVCDDRDETGFRVRGQPRAGGTILTLGRVVFKPAGRAEVEVSSCCWVAWGTVVLESGGGDWVVLYRHPWFQS